MLQLYVIDDQTTSRLVLTEVARSVADDIEVQSFADPSAALASMREHGADLVVTDLRMPVMDGVQLLRGMRQTPGLADVPVMMITVVDDLPVRQQALEAGATDFLVKPIGVPECRARLFNLLQLRRQHRVLHHRASVLEAQIADLTGDPCDRGTGAVLHLAAACEQHYLPGGQNVRRVARYSRCIAAGLGLQGARLDHLEQAASLADIGLLAVPPSVLAKPTRLSREDWIELRRHTQSGADMLRLATSPGLVLGAVVARHHHERWDGSGYPDGLAGTAIPLEARIVAVADAFNAMTSRRPYRHALSIEVASERLAAQRNRMFDTECVDALRAQLQEVAAIRAQFQDQPAATALGEPHVLPFQH